MRRGNKEREARSGSEKRVKEARVSGFGFTQALSLAGRDHFGNNLTLSACDEIANTSGVFPGGARRLQRPRICEKR
jgi:hypothetical protein